MTIRIWVPDSDNLRLCVLLYNMTPISCHFGQNKTLDLIRRNYTCLVSACSSRTTANPVRLAQVQSTSTLTIWPSPTTPIPEKPWNSISMDFIEQLHPPKVIQPSSNCNRLSKQASLFQPTNMITSMSTHAIAELFVLHVFSKHGVLSHVTYNRPEWSSLTLLQVSEKLSI